MQEHRASLDAATRTLADAAEACGMLLLLLRDLLARRGK
jgi:hypothetical protein